MAEADGEDSPPDDEPFFQCRYCFKEFEDADECRLHEAEPHNFACTECAERSFVTEEELFIHLRQHEWKFRVCNHCHNFTCIRPQQMLIHIRSVHPEVARDANPANRAAFDEHKRSLVEIPEDGRRRYYMQGSYTLYFLR